MANVSSAIPGIDFWSRLTWSDLETWAGHASVKRGRTYQRSGRVRELVVSPSGRLMAKVVGTEWYVTTVTNQKEGGDSFGFVSRCSCPIGSRCKHAVAVVAQYLDNLANRSSVPVLADDDPRWQETAAREAFEDDDAFIDSDEEDDLDIKPARRRKKAGPSNSKKDDNDQWPARIQAHLRALTHDELTDWLGRICKEYPEVGQQVRERILLQDTNARSLLSEARKEIKRVTRQPSGRDDWSGQGEIADYSRLRGRLQRLLDLQQFDLVVDLGPELLEQGMDQVASAHDEGETGVALAECMELVFQAYARSSLPVSEKILFAIDAELADDYGVFDDSDLHSEHLGTAEDWSTVADALAARLPPLEAKKAGRDMPSQFERDRITDYLIRSLENADRDEEVLPIYEREAVLTNSYTRLVKYLVQRDRLDDAQRWAEAGIEKTQTQWPGIAQNLLGILRELAEKREQWDLVLAHAALHFIERPGETSLAELRSAAKKAKLKPAIELAARDWLENGQPPFVLKSSGKKKESFYEWSAAWQLPAPRYFQPLFAARAKRGDLSQPQPRVLLELALAAKDEGEILRWYDVLTSKKSNTQPFAGRYYDGYDDQVAAALASSHPERSLAIYQAQLDRILPEASPSAYQRAGNLLKRIKALSQTQSRHIAYVRLVEAIREKYRGRPRFMEVLDGLEARPILESSRRS